MAERTDYFISAVSYNSNHKHIDFVKIHKITENKFGEAEIRTRQAIVKAIKEGTTFATLFKNRVGKWKRGQEVFIFRVKGSCFIKTEGNEKEEDNLGNLPNF